MAITAPAPRRYETVERGSRKWLIAFGIALAPLLETVDSSIVNVALPSIEGNLGATLDVATFVVTGYLTANVIVIPLTPWFAERFGRHQYLTLSIFGFTIMSMICGLSQNIEMLIFTRVLQGFFGGGLIATTQAALRDLFPPEQANVGQAIFGVVIATGPILGPLFGGIIVDQASWPWIFFVNLIPGAISGFVALTMLKSPRDPQKLTLDVPVSHCSRSASDVCNICSTKVKTKIGSAVKRSSGPRRSPRSGSSPSSSTRSRCARRS